MTEIIINVGDVDTHRLWTAVAELTVALPPDWVLVGGLMVQLHVLEHAGSDIRLTQDIDVLGQARPQRALPELDRALRENGFTAHEPDADGYAHRYERNGVIVDLLAPDGIRPPPVIGTGSKAIGIPGGTQALARAEQVTVTLGARSFTLRRPTLIGAILIKARSLMVHHDPDSQREDLLRLLALVDDPRTTACELRTSERRWLSQAESRLAFTEFSTLDRQDIQRAELAYRLLVRDRKTG